MIYNRKESQKYDAWLHWNSTSQCNLSCSYCFGNEPVNKDEIFNIKINPLIDTLDKTGKTFRISFTGGEPFLIPNFVGACSAISKNHFISINSNLLPKKTLEFAKKINPDRVLFIHASVHLKELDDMNMIPKFANNFHRIKEKGFEIIPEAVAYPEIIADVDRYKNLLREQGIEFGFGMFFGEYLDRSFPFDYTNEEITEFKLNRDQIKFSAQKGELCNAGLNAGAVYPGGSIHPCFYIKKKIGNIYSEISFENEMRKCPAKVCGCPLNWYDPYLFEKFTTTR